MKTKEELKTLKDFKKHNIGYNRVIPFGETIIFEELKAEAVKWIKEINKSKSLLKKEGDNYNECKTALNHLQKFIKHFFNLTEDDLK